MEPRAFRPGEPDGNAVPLGLKAQGSDGSGDHPWSPDPSGAGESHFDVQSSTFTVERGGPVGPPFVYAPVQHNTA
jgi:hypothetical protein